MNPIRTEIHAEKDLRPVVCDECGHDNVLTAPIFCNSCRRWRDLLDSHSKKV